MVKFDLKELQYEIEKDKEIGDHKKSEKLSQADIRKMFSTMKKKDRPSEK